MKITVTGSLGNISKPLTQQLIAAGHAVSVISSDSGKITAIEALGAHALIGSVTDEAFLTKAFSGSDVVYTMVPPNYNASDLRQHIGNVGKTYAKAIQQSGVPKVVNLSSIGAHLESGTGPIAGSHDVEMALNQLDNVAVKHIRAPFFMVNFYNDIEMIKHLGFMGANYNADNRLVMVHPSDIADAVAAEITGNFSGKSVRYLVSDDRSLSEITTVLGKAIGKPDLQWVAFTDEQALAAMLDNGMPKEIAEKFTEMGAAIRTGILWNDYDQHKPQSMSKRNLQFFAKEFAEKYTQA